MNSYTKKRPQSIKKLFNNIAKRYDLANLLISFGFSSSWNKKIVQKALEKSPPEFTMVDICSGTGEVAFNCLQNSTKASSAYLVDFSDQMLKIAQNKGVKYAQHKINYVEADAEKLPLADEIADFATIAYGIRNVRTLANCFNEARRVLKPNGKLVILELTRPKSKLLRFLHKLHLKCFIPIIGKIVASDKNAYRYLCSSVQSFSCPAEIKQKLADAKFNKIESTSLLGGIATITTGYKVD